MKTLSVRDKVIFGQMAMLLSKWGRMQKAEWVRSLLRYSDVTEHDYRVVMHGFSTWVEFFPREETNRFLANIRNLKP